jgi:hypothetical protein
MSSQTDLETAVAEFLGAFELVFHHDWKYTRSVIGDIARGATFIEPWLECEREDWGARRDLLQKYGQLVAVMKTRNPPR